MRIANTYPWLLALALAAGAGAVLARAAPEPDWAALLRDPSPAEWRGLSRFDRTLTRSEFEDRLDRVFDPEHGLQPYLSVSREAFAVYDSPARRGEPLAVVRFAPLGFLARPPSVDFRTPAQFRGLPRAAGAPRLAGLRVAIEPADIGGRWAAMEDRSVYFPGYGRINEGDLNLVVARLLARRLEDMGARVFLVRDRAEPLVRVQPGELRDLAEQVMRSEPWMLPEAYRFDTKSLSAGSEQRVRAAEGLLLTKTLETRARADYLRRSFDPDITIVLQHNATPDSSEGRLNPINRNIFFVQGAYEPGELREPEQRFRLLTKLLQDTTPVETAVAASIAGRFKAATGYPPVLSGNSATTRLVVPGNPYVVARNLAFNREHDGPVVVTEPYFMNQAVTLVRLLAGDYPGMRLVAGRMRISIYREYADCVAAGLADVY